MISTVQASFIDRFTKSNTIALSAFVLGLSMLGSTLPGSAQTLAASTAATTAAAKPVTLSAREALLRDTLIASGASGKDLLEFYQANNFDFVWSKGRLRALTETFAKADDHGLPVSRYLTTGLVNKTVGRGDLSDQVALEVSASQAYLRYARDVNSGLLEPRALDDEIHVFPKRKSPVSLLNAAAQSRRMGGLLKALEPTHPTYTALLSEKKRLERAASKQNWGPKVPEGRTMRPGNSGPRVLALRNRLARMTNTELGDAAAYDESLILAVKAFQTKAGLNADGVVGPQTLAAINAGAGNQMAKILVNLERQRWLNFDRGARHVFVNQADFTAQVIDNGNTTFSTRVVIGKNKHKTPEFSDQMTHMVVNPTWHVPRSIATEEYLPQLKKNAAAFKRKGIDVMTRNGTKVNPSLINFAQYNERSFPFIMKQGPGAGNALGRVKFMFPNQFSIYLHDTPAKSLFNKDRRAYSHGCVRVQKPFELAHTLLAPQFANPKATFASLLNAGKERYVNLDTPVPVHLTYLTAFDAADGTIEYRADVYGRDRTVFDALKKAGVGTGAVEG